MSVTDIFRYPVKGLSGERLSTVTVKAGCCLPLDRHFALTHGNSKFNFEQPAWIARRNFTVVAHSPEITRIESRYQPDDSLLTLSMNGDTICKVHTDQAQSDFQISDALSKSIKNGQPGPYKLVSIAPQSLTDSPSQTISIMNNKSLMQLEHAAGKPLDKRRFRGNIWYEGTTAWEENGWENKVITIGDARLRVTGKIERCAAIDADPDLGRRNIAVLKALNDEFRHNHFGVLAEVLVDGVISLDGTIELESG